MVTLTETGTHAQAGAAVGSYRDGEPELAIQMADSAAGMLVIMDRGFPGVALWRAYTGARAHLRTCDKQLGALCRFDHPAWRSCRSRAAWMSLRWVLAQSARAPSGTSSDRPRSVSS